MYHICTGKKTETTIKLLMDALVDLSEYRLLSEIHISDLLKKSTVSRSTFYRNFDRIEDIIHYQINFVAHALYVDFNEMHKDSEPKDKDLISHFYYYWRKEEKLLKVIEKNSRVDILITALRSNIDIFSKVYLPEVDCGSVAYMYWANSCCGMLAQSLVQWVQRDMQDSPEQVAEYFYECSLIADSKPFKIH